MEIVINSCFGRFGISREALHLLRKMGNKTALEETDIGEKWPGLNEIREPFLNLFCREINRTDKQLITVIKKIKEKANAPRSELKIIKIPDNVEWEIDNYDGLETVHEKHNSWS